MRRPLAPAAPSRDPRGRVRDLPPAPGPVGAPTGLKGWRLPARRWPVTHLRDLAAGLGGGRSAHRDRCHAARARPTGVEARRAGGGRTGTGPRARPRIGPPSGWRILLRVRADPCPTSSPWPRAGSWVRRPQLRVRRVRWCGPAGRAWRLRQGLPAGRRAGRGGWRWPGRSGDLAISRSRPRPRMGEARRSSGAPASRAGRRAGSGSAPSRRRHPPARAARRDGRGRRRRRDGPGKEARQDGP